MLTKNKQYWEKYFKKKQPPKGETNPKGIGKKCIVRRMTEKIGTKSGGIVGMKQDTKKRWL